MFSKKKKKDELKPTIFSTSSVTRTQNTITTANGFQRTTTFQTVSYQESRSTSLSSTSGLSILDRRTSSPLMMRTAFNKPIHNYQEKKSIEPPKTVLNSNLKPLASNIQKAPLNFDAQKFPTTTTTISKFTPPNQINQKLNLTSLKDPNVFNNELNSQLKVKVIATGRFLGENSVVPTYNTRSSKNRGRLLLINNIEFKGKKRDGADVDHKNIITLFKQIGFDCVDYRNKKKNEMERIVKSFASDKDLKKYDMCVTVIMSHGTTIGEQTMIETIDEQVLSTEWVVQQFNGDNCKAMNDKPKIFIFQCCRGENENANIQTDAKMFVPPRKVQDILISYSTLPGFVAYRDPKLGSWYIQGLCKVFMEHAHDKHIEDLLKIVDSELSKLNAGSQRQTSSYENRGFKTCYLNPIK